MSVVARSASRRGRAYMTRREGFSLALARARRRAPRGVVCGALFPLARRAHSLGVREAATPSPSRRVVTRRNQIGRRRGRARGRHAATRALDSTRARRETTMDDDGDARDARDDASTPETSAKRDARYEYEIALGSSGWLFVYYVGVVKAMRERGMARCALKTIARCARGAERDGAREGGAVA